MTARGVRSVVCMATVGCTLGLAASSSGAGSFRQRADSACAKAGAKVERLSKDVTVSEIETEIKIVNGLVAHLKQVTPPAAQARQFKKFISQTRTQAVEVNAALAAARKDDKAETEADLKKVAAAGKASDATARSLKLAACAKNYEPEGK